MPLLHRDAQGTNMLRVQSTGQVAQRRYSWDKALVCSNPVVLAQQSNLVAPAGSPSAASSRCSCASPPWKAPQCQPPCPSSGVVQQDPRRPVAQAPDVSLPSALSQAFELNAEDPLVGSGAFAKILRVVESATGTPYAVKVMNRPNFAMRGIEHQISSEIEAMRRCADSGWCRNVLRLHDTVEENDHTYLLLELCSCDLLRYASNQPGGRLGEKESMFWTQQLLTGLRDLHCLGILHRDIKPENLLLTADGVLRIADFGWCADLRDGPSSLAGTFQYMAPEILSEQGVQTEAVDVWSAGVSVLQLLTARLLLNTYIGPGATNLTMTDPRQATKVKTQRLIVEINEKCPPSDDARPSSVSWCCWDLLRRMLVPEVSSRVSVAEALGHPWMQQAPGQNELPPPSASPQPSRQESSGHQAAGVKSPVEQPQQMLSINSNSTPVFHVHTPAQSLHTPSVSPRKAPAQSSPLTPARCHAPDTLVSHWQGEAPMSGSSQKGPSESSTPRITRVARSGENCMRKSAELLTVADVLSDCQERMSSMLQQLQSREKGGQETHLRNLTEIVRNCTVNMQRASSAWEAAARTRRDLEQAPSGCSPATVRPRRSERFSSAKESFDRHQSWRSSFQQRNANAGHEVSIALSADEPNIDLTAATTALGDSTCGVMDTSIQSEEQVALRPCTLVASTAPLHRQPLSPQPQSPLAHSPLAHSPLAHSPLPHSPLPFSPQTPLAVTRSAPVVKRAAGQPLGSSTRFGFSPPATTPAIKHKADGSQHSHSRQLIMAVPSVRLTRRGSPPHTPALEKYARIDVLHMLMCFICLHF